VKAKGTEHDACERSEDSEKQEVQKTGCAHKN